MINKSMGKYLFYPYRGIYYENGLKDFGTQILIVGDSLYCINEDKCPHRNDCLMNPHAITNPCTDET